MEGWELQISASHSDGLGCFFFCFVFFFSRSAGGYCFLGFIVLKKGVVLSVVVAQICGSVEGGVTLVRVPAGNFFRLVVFRTFVASLLASRSLQLAPRFRLALRSAKSYIGRWLSGSLLSHGPNVPPGLFMT